jgi:hypothetical protein
MVEQREDTVSDQVRYRLMTAEEQQHACGGYFLIGHPAVLICRHQPAHAVVSSDQ